MNRIINIPKIILDKNGPSLPYIDFFWIFSIILSSSSLLNDKTENHNTEDNNTNLNVNELTKIKRVMSKVIPNAPHEVLLVLDGSTGQNAFEQAKQFTNATEVTSLAITKLDGTAKGGVLLGISDQFQIPVRFIGVGEGIDDLQEFDPQNFIQTLFS